MTIAKGVAKKLRYGIESSWAVPSVAAGQSLRRVTSNLDLKKAVYSSNEIREDYQIAVERHGVRSIDGAINGELSPGTYADFFAASLRAAFAAGVTSGPLSDVTAAATGVTFTRGSGSFITAGFKSGDIVRASGFTSPAVANNAKNGVITALTATQMTVLWLDRSLTVAKAAGDTVTIAVYGKKSIVPVTGHTDVSFSIEHWYSDILESELFIGCKVQSIAVNLPATGMATVAITFMGKDSVYQTATAYFTTPLASTTSSTLAAVNGAVIVGGVSIGVITGMSFTIDSGMSAEPVVGSNTYPEIQPGRVKLTGQMTVFFTDVTFRNFFANEVEFGAAAVFTASNLPGADFIGFSFQRLKANGISKDDGEKGLVQTVPFSGLLNVGGGPATATDYTTLSVQDSLA